MRAFLIFAMSVILFAPALPSHAEGGGLRLFITYPDLDYAVGSVIEVQVSVFDDCRRVDPDTLELCIGMGRLPVALERQGMGCYTAAITILHEYLDPGHFLVLRGETSLASVYAEDRRYPWVLAEPGLDVQLIVNDPDDLLPEPGQAVEFIVHVANGDEFIDPLEGTLNVSLVNGTGKSGTVPTLRVGTGQFKGVVVIPDDEGDRGPWDLVAFAEAKIWPPPSYEVDYRADTDHQKLYLRTLDVWYSLLNHGREMAVIAVFVSDLYGVPIEGARIELDYGYINQQGRHEEGHEEQTTESGGWVLCMLEYPGIDPAAWEVEFQGTCSVGGLTQGIRGAIHLDDRAQGRVPYDPYRFEAVPRDRIVPSGERTVVTFDVTQGGTPLPNCTVSGYVADGQGIYWSGEVQADASGSFSIPIDARPYRYEGGWFRTVHPDLDIRLVDGTVVDAMDAWLCISDWESEWQMREALDTTTGMAVSPGPEGGTLRFELRSEGAVGAEEQVRVLWGVGRPPGPVDLLYGDVPPDIGPMDYFEQDWQVQADVAWSDGAYRGTIRVPRCVPQLTNLYLTAELTLYGGPVPDVRYAYIENITPFMSNDQPTVAFASPPDGASCRGVMVVEGSATDDRGVVRVEVRLDGGPWAVAKGTDGWECLVDAAVLPRGDHVLEARSFDGQKYSAVARVGFDVPGEEGTSGSEWLVVVVVVLTCMAVGGILGRLGRRR